MKLSSAALRPLLAAHERGALPLVGAAWGVTARKSSHNASNTRGVTAGKMGRNSSNNNNNSIVFKSQWTRGQKCMKPQSPDLSALQLGRRIFSLSSSELIITIKCTSSVLMRINVTLITRSTLLALRGGG